MITASLVSYSADVAVIELHMTLKRLISQHNPIVSGCLLNTPRPDLFNYLSVSPSWPCFPFLGWLLGCIFLEADRNSFSAQSLLNHLTQQVQSSWQIYAFSSPKHPKIWWRNDVIIRKVNHWSWVFLSIGPVQGLLGHQTSFSLHRHNRISLSATSSSRDTYSTVSKALSQALLVHLSDRVQPLFMYFYFLTHLQRWAQLYNWHQSTSRTGSGSFLIHYNQSCQRSSHPSVVWLTKSSGANLMNASAGLNQLSSALKEVTV